jgi:hypothetical protein
MQTLCDEVCQCLVTGRWIFLGTPVSSTNKTDNHDITELLLKVALNTITLYGVSTHYAIEKSMLNILWNEENVWSLIQEIKHNQLYVTYASI